METKAYIRHLPVNRVRLWLSGLTFLLIGACANERPDFGETDEPTKTDDPAQTDDPDASDGNSEGTDSPSGEPSAMPSSTASPAIDDATDDDPLPDPTVGAPSATVPDDCEPGDPGCEVDPAPSGDPAADCSEGCLIDDTCYSDGEINADNTCQVCDVALSDSEWSNDDGKSCSDGRFCTLDDSCSAGECVGEDRVCDDGVACNGVETCDDAESQCQGAATNCTGSEICDVATDTCNTECAGCVIGGNCYAEGSPSPVNSCLVCDSAAAADDWSVDVGASCDDGDLCTEDDVCDASGQCGGAEVVCAGDSDVCGADRSCDPGTGMCVEQYPGVSVTCNDMDACTANDHCDGAGACLGTPTANSAAGCACVVDADCNDDLSCTQDTCSASNTCSNTLQAGSCLIGGMCRDANAPDPANPCRVCDAAQSQTAWSNAGASTSCDDGVWCNGADTCSGGTCTHEFQGGSRCAGGTTCNNTCNEQQQNCFSPNTQVCGNPTEFRCQTGCGGNAESRQGTQFCTGFSAQCAGTINYPTTWNVADDCAATELCSGNATSASCVSNHRCTCEASTETFYDVESELCWEKDHSDQIHTGPSGTTYCAARDTGDITDWEIPNIVDLITLIRGCRNGVEDDINERSLCIMEVDGLPDPSCGENATCNGVETCSFCDETEGPASGCYWPTQLEGTCSHHYSGTAATSQSYWRVDFRVGSVDQGHTNTNSSFVRCVYRP